MLTPHEVATLMLIEDAAPNVADLDRATIEALVERQLVHLENLGYGDRLHITTRATTFCMSSRDCISHAMLACNRAYAARPRARVAQQTPRYG